MQYAGPGTTQAKFFVSTVDLDHPILHTLDDTQALLDWTEIEALLTIVYAVKKGVANYPLLTLFRSLLLACGLVCRMRSRHSARI